MRVTAYSVNAFTLDGHNGNGAGIVIDGSFSTEQMQTLAYKIGFSETTFLTKTTTGYQARFFTPNNEVDLCGHATVATFGLLSSIADIPIDNVFLTKAGNIKVTVDNDEVWLNIGKPILKECNVTAEDLNKVMGTDIICEPSIVACGLTDIYAQTTKEGLAKANPNFVELAELSRKVGVVGVHLYTTQGDETAHCRNFAPLYGIDEECATGTSNAGLTYLLYTQGIVNIDERNIFIQGEKMGKPSMILTRIDNDGMVSVGGCITVNGKIEVEL